MRRAFQNPCGHPSHDKSKIIENVLRHVLKKQNLREEFVCLWCTEGERENEEREGEVINRDVSQMKSWP